MGEGNIPPPNINFKTGEFNLAEGLLINAEQDTFQNYLDESRLSSDEERQRLDEEAKQREDKLRAMVFEEIEEAEDVEDAQEESELEEEEKLSERDAELDEQLAQKAAARQQRKELSDIDEGEEPLEELEQQEEGSRQLQGSRQIAERGGEEAFFEEKDPLEAAKKDIKAEKEEMAEHIQEKDEDLSHQKQSTQISKHKKADKEHIQDKSEAREAPKDKQHTQKSPANQNIATNIDTSMQAQRAESTRSQKTQQASLKTDLHEQFEALAHEIVSEAHVLENGDVIETTISLNMKNSIFDQGEVTVTAYRYRPLEVNLAFKKFNHEATGIMQKNSSKLKKVLKEKSLKVHQLDIIE